MRITNSGLMRRCVPKSREELMEIIEERCCNSQQKNIDLYKH